MAVYAIGDLQGCYTALRRLLDKLAYEPSRDTLWFAGDLVNRGPDSLACLRFVKSLGGAAVSVLGNHDLHLLARDLGVRTHHPEDTFETLLTAPDREELLAWLRRQPLLHHDPQLNFTLAHAGIYPWWDLATATTLAQEVSEILQSCDYPELIRHMYGNQPSAWHAELAGYARWRFIINAFTRMRYCDRAGHLDFANKQTPGRQTDACLPWFEIPERVNCDLRILFGHWSTLGKVEHSNIFPLDSGCVWGGALSALELSASPHYHRVDCEAAALPGGE